MKRFLLFGLFAFAIGVAFATTDTDKQAATTKKYLHNELSEIQDTIPAESGTKAVTYTTTAGDIESRTVTTNLGSGTGDTTLPTVGAVNVGLGTKQNKIPARNTNTVLTYTNTEGTVGQKGIYQDTGSYAAQQKKLIDAATFNAALQNALNTEFVCADVSDAHDPVTGNCWLWEIHTVAPNRSPNLFDMSKIRDRVNSVYSITRNADGSIFLDNHSTGNSALNTYQKLSTLAPELEIGKTYVLSINTTGYPRVHLHGPNQVWADNGTKTITQEILDAYVQFYTNGVNTTSTIYSIQIEEGTTPTPYVPYGENIYIPQNQ